MMVESKIATGDVMKNLDYTSLVPHEKYYTVLLYAAINSN